MRGAETASVYGASLARTAKTKRHMNNVVWKTEFIAHMKDSVFVHSRQLAPARLV